MSAEGYVMKSSKSRKAPSDPENESSDTEQNPLAAELKRRHRAGESHVALATEYGLMPSRVAQLIREE